MLMLPVRVVIDVWAACSWTQGILVNYMYDKFVPCDCAGAGTVGF